MKNTAMTNWDAESWKASFQTASKLRDRDSLRALRKRVFTDTCQWVREGEYVAPSGNIIRLDTVTSSYLVKTPIAPQPAQEYESVEIEVWNEDTLLAAKRLKEGGYHPAALNMANRQTPGGGVYEGSGAQEENLFRRTNLLKELYKYAPFAEQYGVQKASEGYPMDRNYGGVMARGITVFRGTEEDGYPLLEEPYVVDIVSVAAIRNPDTENGRLTPKMIEGTKNKIRTIFRLAISNGNDALVLGAFGCGAFRNPPEHMAEIFGEVLDESEFRHAFRKVVFAIIDDHNAHLKHNAHGNYWPFRNYFDSRKMLRQRLSINFEMSRDYVNIDDGARVLMLIEKTGSNPDKYVLKNCTEASYNGGMAYDQVVFGKTFDDIVAFNSFSYVAYVALRDGVEWNLYVVTEDPYSPGGRLTPIHMAGTMTALSDVTAFFSH